MPPRTHRSKAARRPLLDDTHGLSGGNTPSISLATHGNTSIVGQHIATSNQPNTVSNSE